MAALFFFMCGDGGCRGTLPPPRVPPLLVALGGNWHRAPLCRCRHLLPAGGILVAGRARRYIVAFVLRVALLRSPSAARRSAVGAASHSSAFLRPRLKNIARYKLRLKCPHYLAPLITAIFCGLRQLAAAAVCFIVSWCRSSRDGCGSIIAPPRLRSLPLAAPHRLIIEPCRRSNRARIVRLGHCDPRRMVVPVPSPQAASCARTLRGRNLAVPRTHNM